MNGTEQIEDSIVGLFRIKLVQEMFALLTPEEKHALALKYVDQWLAQQRSYWISDTADKVLREEVRVYAKERVAEEADRIKEALQYHVEKNRAIDNEAWQTYLKFCELLEEEARKERQRNE